MPRFKSVLFDLDGTLINSEYFYFECWNALLRPYNVQITFEDWMNTYVGHTLPENAKNLKDKYRLPVELDELIQRRLDASVKRFENEDVPLMPHAVELLEFLKQKDIQMAIVTSSLRADVETIFRRNGLAHYFKFMITKNEVTKAKPDPEGYNQACQLMSLPKDECLVIEDTHTGLTAAKAAGLTCYAVQSAETDHPRLQEADGLFTSLAQIQQHLLPYDLV